ncbi:hypothetical protein [Ligilactobacillus apodemi]|uniref:hypothetical protein n=1 Tax=Ligilactobacillus apodemi TaxID=307126 RepID=UPI00214D0621|nr:hypothetical protein [Ligilactobacillus apodemi]MCR1902291.1 hypothetical protein [Ligilactobacillus apodemi]
MTVKEFNLDALLDNTTKAKVRIAGEVYSIAIDDEMFKKLTMLQTEVSAYFSKLENTSEEEFIEMGEQGREDFVNKVFTELRTKLTVTLDEIFGEGVGEKLYVDLGNKISALSFLIAQLRDIYTDSVKEKRKAEKKQNDRMNVYMKKKRKNRK